jgi:hypothetical protein
MEETKQAVAEVSMVLEKILSREKHGNIDIFVQVREHKIVDVKATFDYRRGKEFAIKET